MASPEMLEWQWRQILAQLDQIQLHASDQTCPCTLGEDNEFCIAKHCLLLSSLAAETALMDPPNSAMLLSLQETATDAHLYAKDKICTEDTNYLNYAEWARKWRKDVEALYYSCQMNQSCLIACTMKQFTTTKEYWQMTRKEFESSKQILFHGTKSEFDIFDTRHAGKSDPGLLGKGVYFTPSREQAESFATNPHYGGTGTPRVIAAIVDLKNPIIIQDAHLPDGRRLADIHPQGITKASGKAINNELRKAGHDGGIFISDKEVMQVVAFDLSVIITHRQAVQQALADGWSVPDKVLADYPDIGTHQQLHTCTKEATMLEQCTMEQDPLLDSISARICSPGLCQTHQYPVCTKTESKALKSCIMQAKGEDALADCISSVGCQPRRSRRNQPLEQCVATA